MTVAQRVETKGAIPPKGWSSTTSASRSQPSGGEGRPLLCRSEVAGLLGRTAPARPPLHDHQPDPGRLQRDLPDGENITAQRYQRPAWASATCRRDSIFRGMSVWENVMAVVERASATTKALRHDPAAGRAAHRTRADPSGRCRVSERRQIESPRWRSSRRSCCWTVCRINPLAIADIRASSPLRSAASAS